MSREAVCSDAAVPELMDMEQMFRHHPHMLSNAQPAAAAAAAAAGGGAAAASNPFSNAARLMSDHAVRLEQEQAAQVDPWESEAYRSARAQLATPVFVDHSTAAAALHQPLNQEQLRARLISKQRHLCVQSASHEDRVLKEAGAWTGADGVRRVYPACMLGEECCGNKSQYWIRDQTRKITWMALVFESEWREFMDSTVFVGPARMCLLDHRLLLPTFIARRRLILMQGADSKVTITEEEPDEALQAYYNLVNCEGGYFGQYVFLPEPGEPMFQPIVRMNRSTLQAERTASGQMRANQAQLVWRTSAVQQTRPAIGEQLESF